MSDSSYSLKEVVSEQRLLEILADCLEAELEAVSSTSTREGTDGWDSVAHLSLLGMLDDEIPGILDRCPGLADAAGVTEILTLLNEHC